MNYDAIALYAYIDPATGAIVLQVIAAAVFSVGLIFRRVLFAPFTMLFGRRSTPEGGTDGLQDDADSNR